MIESDDAVLRGDQGKGWREEGDKTPDPRWKGFIKKLMALAGDGTDPSIDGVNRSPGLFPTDIEIPDRFTTNCNARKSNNRNHRPSSSEK